MSLKPWERGATILIEAVAVSRAIQECSNEIKRLQAELAALKTQNTEPVAVIKVWKHPIDGNHIDVSTYKEILDLPEGEYDLYVEAPLSVEAAVANFKQRAVKAIESLPLIEGE